VFGAVVFWDGCVFGFGCWLCGVSFSGVCFLVLGCLLSLEWLAGLGLVWVGSSPPFLAPLGLLCCSSLLVVHIPSLLLWRGSLGDGKDFCVALD